ncbi:hypothetical protein F4813DRAFT_344600 [Daldinia decipiens]|uniref:uncharacterized protein n=1 Tax=Daldinia decipiens TaxID=326647 RepID=UPI0020C1D33D|nr:uncharacterized protein F4813DRAFT_344600 [Daldinia decipiens]KAI1662460.1 hypothetical protein F4813DRAFT_344600 [Daldinia decipiens]
MDSYRRAIVNLSDVQHPNYGLTKLNDASKFLSMLPKEVRLMIYEYTVYASQEIRPLQLESRSNKFICYILMPSSKDRLCRHQPAVVSLARVCRAIYAELEHFQPFYKVNKFYFTKLTDLRTYLAAITPSRRQAIRRVDFRINDWFDHWLLAKRIFSDSPTYPVDHGTLVILSQTNLEEFTLIEEISDLPPGTVAADVLRQNLKQTLEYPDGLHTMRNLPCFRLGFVLESPDETTDKLIKEINEALETRRRRIGTDIPEWFKQLNNFRSTEKALREVGDLDILGEDRVALDRAASYFGSISSRTRGKCRLPNSEGQILKNTPRYSADGILTSYICGIADIRWDGTDVQCQVSHRHGDKSWEDVSAILIPDNVRAIISFYNHMIEKKDSSHLDEIKSKPTLRDILKIQGGFHFIQHTGAEGYRKKALSYMREDWLASADRWDTYIAELETAKTLGGQREEATRKAKRRARRRS